MNVSPSNKSASKTPVPVGGARIPANWAELYQARIDKMSNRELTRSLKSVESRLKDLKGNWLPPELKGLLKAQAKMLRAELNERGIVPGHGAGYMGPPDRFEPAAGK